MWGWKPEKKRKMEKLHIKKNWTKQSENLTSWKNKKKSWKKLRFDELNEMENDCK